MPLEKALKHSLIYKKRSCFYWTLGEKKNPPLVLVCGFTGTHSDLLQLGHALENSFYCIIPDFPGWGKSEKLQQQATIYQYANFLFSVIQNEKLTSVAIVAHCMGCAIAIEFGYLFQKYVTALFLVSVPYQEGLWSKNLFLHLADMSSHAPQPLRRIFFLWRTRFIGVPLSFYVLKFRTFHKKLTVTIKNALARRKENEETVEQNWISLVHFNYNKVKNFLFPVYVIHGNKDLLIPPRQGQKFSEKLKQSTFTVIPEAGHLPPVETPKHLARYICSLQSETLNKTI